MITWTSLGKWQLPEIGPRQLDYYNLLVSGFRHGSLALDIDVPEAIRNSHDPWDPLKRPAVPTPADVSYFRGHYYLYFGVVPAVVIFWPFRAATGHDLPLVYGTLVFSLGAFFIAWWLWLRISRNHFPEASLLTKCAGILTIGLVGGQLVLVRRISIWEPPIVAGNFFAVCMLASGYCGLRSQRPWSWLALSGLSLGLAVGSRPSLAAAGAGLVVVVLAVSARNSGAGMSVRALRRAARASLAAGLPLAAIAVGLLAYNKARFGNPFEFGIKYQLSGVDPTQAHLFSLSYAHYNFSNYFLRSPQWGRYFPFLHPVSASTQVPAGYYGTEFVYGALVVCPVLWWILCLPRGSWRRHGDTVLVIFSGSLAATATATTAILLCFNTAAARYEVDFMPWWIWLSILGWASLERGVTASAPARPVVIGLFRAAFFVSAAISLTLAFAQSCELHGILVFENPNAYRKISGIFDGPTAFAERLLKFRVGPIEMDVSFAKRPLNSVEPLLVTGVEYQRDYVFVHYQSATTVNFGFMPSGGKETLGPDITVEEGRRYRMRIECGSLYPPEGHPLFDGWDLTDIRSLKRWATIELNGHLVYSQRTSSNEASPGTLQIGKDSKGGLYGARFSGIISNVARSNWTRPPTDLSLSGDFDLKLTLAGEDEPTQPLIVAGRTGNADLLGVRTVDRLHYVLVYECWGAGLWQSGPIPMPESRALSLRVRFGPLLRVEKNSPLEILRRSLVVSQDNLPVWWHRTMRPLDPSPKFGFSGNTIGSSAMLPEFEGRRTLAVRTRPPEGWRQGPFSGFEMDLAGRGDGSEPVAVTGYLSHSDMLAINWLPHAKAELIYDHSGQAVAISPIFNWPDGELHRLKVKMPSFLSLDGSQGPKVGMGKIQVELDGLELWDKEAPFFPTQSATLTIGRNRVSSSFASDEMRCVVFDVKQLPK